MTFTISGTAPTSGSLSNSAGVTPPPGVTDPNPGDNVDGPVVTEITGADVSVTKNGQVAVAPGGTVTYTVEVSNTGPQAANAQRSPVAPPTLEGVIRCGRRGEQTARPPRA